MVHCSRTCKGHVFGGRPALLRRTRKRRLRIPYLSCVYDLIYYYNTSAAHNASSRTMYTRVHRYTLRSRERREDGEIIHAALYTHAGKRNHCCVGPRVFLAPKTSARPRFFVHENFPPKKNSRRTNFENHLPRVGVLIKGRAAPRRCTCTGAPAFGRGLRPESCVIRIYIILFSY